MSKIIIIKNCQSCWVRFDESSPCPLFLVDDMPKEIPTDCPLTDKDEWLREELEGRLPKEESSHGDNFAKGGIVSGPMFIPHSHGEFVIPMRHYNMGKVTERLKQLKPRT